MNDHNIDDSINFGFEQFLQIFDWPYIFGLIFFAWVALKLVGLIPETGLLSILTFLKKLPSIWVVIGVGLLWGWGLIGLRGGLTEQMVISFPFAVVIHKALLQKILIWLKLE